MENEREIMKSGIFYTFIVRLIVLGIVMMNYFLTRNIWAIILPCSGGFILALIYGLTERHNETDSYLKTVNILIIQFLIAGLVTLIGSAMLWRIILSWEVNPLPLLFVSMLEFLGALFFIAVKIKKGEKNDEQRK